MEISISGSSNLFLSKGLNRISNLKNAPLPDTSPGITGSMDNISLSSPAPASGKKRGDAAETVQTTVIRRSDEAFEASHKAGKNRDFFWETAYSLQDDAEQQIAYLEFAAGLSKEDLDHFLTALKKDPDALPRFLETASQLDAEALSPFLEVASLFEGDLDSLIAMVNTMQEQENASSGRFQYVFLSAAAKTGIGATEFMNAFNTMPEQDRAGLVGFVENTIGDHLISGDNADLFAEFLSFAGKNELTEFMDSARELKNEDLTHLLAGAAESRDCTGDFISCISDYSSRGEKNFSDFLSVAAHAEDKLGIFLNLVREQDLDLETVSAFTVVDTVNFLDAAALSGESAGRLLQVGKTLEQENRSYFFYAAADVETDMENLLAKTAQLKDDDLSEFLLETASRGEAAPDRTVYMKGLLTDSEYKDFSAAAKHLSEGKVRDFVEMTNTFTGLKRTDFLDMASLSGPAADKFISIFDTLSLNEQEDYLSVGMHLDLENRRNFVQASINAEENLNTFVRVTREIISHSESAFGRKKTLDDFLSVAQEADAGDLPGFIRLLDTLDKTQRTAFIMTARNSDLELSQLTTQAASASSLGGKRFNDIFSYANFNSDRSKLSSDDYQNLIKTAGNLDDEAWDRFMYAVFHFDVPLSRLTSIAESSSIFSSKDFDYLSFRNFLSESDGEAAAIDVVA